MRIALTRKQRKKGSGRKLSQYDYVAGPAGAQVRGDPLRTSGNPIQSGIKEPPPFNREALQPELIAGTLGVRAAAQSFCDKNVRIYNGSV